MTTRRFVFVPIFGELECRSVETADAWLKQPHIKVWGFICEDDAEDMIVIHSDPIVPAVRIGERVRLLGDELNAMHDVPENSTDLPDAVCVALAKLALAPELGGLTDDQPTA